MRAILKVSAFVLLVALGTGSGQLCAQEKRAAQPAASEQQKAIEKARTAVARNRLTTLKPDCVSYDAEDGAGATTVNVRELHNAKCGGDPATAPRLFSIEIDQKTGKMKTDAGSLTGEYKAIK
jgi:hypothetical protein